MGTTSERAASDFHTSGAYFDPMEYDVMRETATRLGGEYIYWARKMREHGDVEAAKTLMGYDAEVMREADAVDNHNERAIAAKTKEFADKLSQIKALADSGKVQQLITEKDDDATAKHIEAIYRRIIDFLNPSTSKSKMSRQKAHFSEPITRVARA